MDKDGTFYALSTDKGRVQWKRKIGSLNASAPAYADGRLFAVNLEPHQAVALRPNDARQQGAVAPSAARAQRVLAARPRRQGDLRLRVGGHLRPRREDRQDQMDRVNGRPREGRPGVQRRHGVRRQLRGGDLRDRRLERQRQVDGPYAGRRPAARRRRLLHPGGGLGPGLPRQPGRAHLQLRGEDRRAGLEPLDGRRGLPIARRRGHAALAPHRLRRLAGQALLRARRPHRRAALGAPGRRGGARVLQRGRRDGLRLDDRAEHRHLRLQRQEGQEGVRDTTRASTTR